MFGVDRRLTVGPGVDPNTRSSYVFLKKKSFCLCPSLLFHMKMQTKYTNDEDSGLDGVRLSL